MSLVSLGQNSRLKLSKSVTQYVAGNSGREFSNKKIVRYLTTPKSPSVVHVVTMYQPSLGGMETVVRKLASMQAKGSSNISVVTSNRNAKSGIIDDGFPVRRLKSFEVAHTTIIPSLFFKLLRIDRNVVVHLHIAQAYTPEMVWLASKAKGFKYIAHLHLDFQSTGPVGFMLKIYKPLVLKHVLRAANFVIVFTKDQQLSVHRKYGIEPSKIKVIPNGVEDKYYNDKLPRLHRRPRLLL